MARALPIQLIMEAPPRPPLPPILARPPPPAPLPQARWLSLLAYTGFAIAAAIGTLLMFILACVLGRMLARRRREEEEREGTPSGMISSMFGDADAGSGYVAAAAARRARIAAFADTGRAAGLRPVVSVELISKEGVFVVQPGEPGEIGITCIGLACDSWKLVADSGLPAQRQKGADDADQQASLELALAQLAPAGLGPPRVQLDGPQQDGTGGGHAAAAPHTAAAAAAEAEAGKATRQGHGIVPMRHLDMTQEEACSSQIGSALCCSRAGVTHEQDAEASAQAAACTNISDGVAARTSMEPATAGGASESSSAPAHHQPTIGASEAPPVVDAIASEEGAPAAVAGSPT